MKNLKLAALSGQKRSIIKVGDVVELKIEHIGSMKNEVVAAK